MRRLRLLGGCGEVVEEIHAILSRRGVHTALVLQVALAARTWTSLIGCDQAARL